MNIRDKIELEIHRGRHGDADQSADRIAHIFSTWLGTLEGEMHQLIVDTEDVDQHEAAETIVGALRQWLEIDAGVMDEQE